MDMSLFPLGIAEGDAFCNRVSERQLLSDNIKFGIHTVVSAPRRYGKSSLIKKTITDMRIHYAWIDFLTVATKEEVTLQINKLISYVIYTISPDLKKIKLQLNKLFKNLNPEVNFNINAGIGVSSSVKLQPNSEHSLSIDESLLQLDAIASKVNKRIVFVFDEFQQISLLKEYVVIEAAIRHAVERSKNITYIFSGSNRHLLEIMFSSSYRPLYKLCQVMQIERIHEVDYVKFINKLANKKWHKDLEKDTLDAIMIYTERHPFYINALCGRLWQRCTKLPTIAEVEKIWQQFIATNKSTIITDLLGLSLNQKKVINGLSNAPSKEVSGKDFVLKVKLSSSSILQAVEVLLAKDIIFFDVEQQVYKILDPAVKYYLCSNLN